MAQAMEKGEPAQEPTMALPSVNQELHIGVEVPETFRQALEARPEECSGDCTATEMAWFLVQGECPNPCDAKHLAAAGRFAKVRAWQQAMQQCRNKGLDCICLDGKSTTLVDGCKTFELPDSGGIKMCLYFALVNHRGKCKPIP